MPGSAAGCQQSPARGHLSCSVPTWCDVIFCRNSLAVRETHPKTSGLPRMQSVPPTCPLKLRQPREKEQTLQSPRGGSAAVALGASRQPCWVGTLPSQRVARGASSPLRTPGHCFRSRDCDSTSACQGCPKGTAGGGL